MILPNLPGIGSASGEALSGIDPPFEEDSSGMGPTSGEDESGIESGSGVGMFCLFWLISSYYLLSLSRCRCCSNQYTQKALEEPKL